LKLSRQPSNPFGIACSAVLASIERRKATRSARSAALGAKFGLPALRWPANFGSESSASRVGACPWCRYGAP
jgi:hypothetical protein